MKHIEKKEQLSSHHDRNLPLENGLGMAFTFIALCVGPTNMITVCLPFDKELKKAQKKTFFFALFSQSS